MNPQEAHETLDYAQRGLEALKALLNWVGASHAYLSTRTDYARGYREGIEQAKNIVKDIIEAELTKKS